MGTRQEDNVRLKRRLRTLDGAAVVVASMVGAGIFTAAGYAAHLDSVFTLLGLWLVGGIYSLCGAFCYAELGARFPEAGGEYVYLREAYGKPVAFLSGWISFVAGFSGAIALFSISFVGYLGVLVPSWDPERIALSIGGRALPWKRIAAIGVVAFSTLVHCRRFKVGIVYQDLLTGLKVLAMIVFVVGGLLSPAGRWSELGKTTGAAPSLSVLAGCFAAVLFSYSGWNAAGYMAEEMKNPSKSVARALIAGTLTVTVLYLLFNLVYALALPLPSFAEDERIAYRAAEVLFGGRWAGGLAAAFGVLLLATVGANVLTGPRVYFSMARDGLFPRALCGGVNKWGVPQRAVIFQGAVASILLLAGGFQTLLYWVTFVINVFATLAVLSVVVTRRRHGAPETFRVPLYPLPVIVFCAISGFFSVWIFGKYTETSLAGVGLIAAGLLVFVGWRTFSRSSA